MSRRIPSEKGAINTLATNQVVLIEINTRVSQLFPRTSRSSMTATNGRTAVATRAWGLRASKMPAGSTTEI